MFQMPNCTCLFFISLLSHYFSRLIFPSKNIHFSSQPFSPRIQLKAYYTNVEFSTYSTLLSIFFFLIQECSTIFVMISSSCTVDTTCLSHRSWSMKMLHWVLSCQNKWLLRAQRLSHLRTSWPVWSVNWRKWSKSVPRPLRSWTITSALWGVR